MDKQKQIEEMAKELCCFYDKQKRKCSNCFGMEEDCDLHCSFGRTLERLHNAGYRKIPEDAVVLMKDEKQKLLHEMYEQGKFDALADLQKAGKIILTKEELTQIIDKVLIEARGRASFWTAPNGDEIPEIYIDTLEEICNDIKGEIK